MLNIERHAFIFDMDGVLTDNMRFHADAWVDLFRDFGLQGLDAERYLVETAGMKGLDVLRYFLDPNISETEAGRLTELKDFLYRVRSRDLMKPLPGLEKFLDLAESQCVRLGVGTGSGSKNINYTLGMLNMAEKFQAVVDPSQVRSGKPHPDIFLHVAALLDVQPSACIVFEDALPGVEASQRAGMQCVAVTTTNSASDFRSFDNIIAIIDDFVGLSPAGLLQKLSGRVSSTLV